MASASYSACRLRAVAGRRSCSSPSGDTKHRVLCEPASARRASTHDFTCQTADFTCQKSRFSSACASLTAGLSKNNGRRALVRARASSPSEAHVADVGGYTPFPFVHFNDQELMHDIELEVQASALTCYNLWADPERLQEFLEFISDYTDLNAKAEAEKVEIDGITAGITLMYRFGTYPTLELKFVANRTDDIPGEVFAFESVEGMPIVGAVEFAEDVEADHTKVRFRVVYKMPVELGLFEESVSVRNNVEWLLRKYLGKFKQMAESGLF